MTGDVHHGAHVENCDAVAVAGVRHLPLNLSGLFRRLSAPGQFALPVPASVSAPGATGDGHRLPVAGPVAGRKPAGCHYDDFPGLAGAAGRTTTQPVALHRSRTRFAVASGGHSVQRRQ